MNDLIPILWRLTAGAALGAAFFGGLWWTVRRGMVSRCPALWFMGSFMARTAMALVGFLCLSEGSWQHLVAAVAGFFSVKLVFLGLHGTASESR